MRKKQDEEQAGRAAAMGSAQEEHTGRPAKVACVHVAGMVWGRAHACTAPRHTAAAPSRLEDPTRALPCPSRSSTSFPPLLYPLRAVDLNEYEHEYESCRSAGVIPRRRRCGAPRQHPLSDVRAYEQRGHAGAGAGLVCSRHPGHAARRDARCEGQGQDRSQLWHLHLAGPPEVCLSFSCVPFTCDARPSATRSGVERCNCGVLSPRRHMENKLKTLRYQQAHLASHTTTCSPWLGKAAARTQHLLRLTLIVQRSSQGGGLHGPL